MDENYKIYVHIFPNGKLYIGQTRLSLSYRFGKNGNKYKGCKRFYEAIKENGWDNIKHILLFDDLSSEMADIIEIYLIKKYKTYDINYGYNMTLGGKDGVYKKSCSQYDLDGNFIYEYSNISIAVEKYGYAIYQNLVGDTLSAYGYQWSYDKKEKIDKYKQKINGINEKRRSVYQYDLSGIFIKSYKSVSEAEKETKIPYYRISSCANNKTKSAGGYMWSYIKKEKIEPYKYYDRKKKDKSKNPPNTKVYQYDLNGKFIKEFNSIKDAIKELSIKNGSLISACCKGKKKSAYGYMWRYYKIEYIEEYKSQRIQKNIIQYDKNNNAINTYFGFMQAEKSTGIPHSNILKCCEGERISAGGFIWRYE